jgi:hypothetical protein
MEGNGGRPTSPTTDFFQACAVTFTNKGRRLEQILSLEVQGILSPEMAQSERDRAETTYNEALQSASEVRDRRPGPLVQPSGVTEAMSTLDDEIQILGETKAHEGAQTQLCLMGGKVSQAPALLSLDTRAQQSSRVRAGIGRAKAQNAADKSASTRMDAFVCRGLTQEHLQSAMHLALKQREAARPKSFVSLQGDCAAGMLSHRHKLSYSVLAK